MKEKLFLRLVIFLATNSVVRSLQDGDELENYYSNDVVDYIDTLSKTNILFNPSSKRGYIRRHLGFKKDSSGIALPYLEDFEEKVELPETFDAREKWSYCKSLQTVRDQGSCLSCWAVASASVFTDRLCIATKGRFNSQLSAQDLITCGSPDGCNEGDPKQAFKYFETDGIVTGGDYHSGKGCQPYTIPDCNLNNSCGPELPTPKCRKYCFNKKYKHHSFKKDLHFIKVNSSFVISCDTKKIQMEIYTNGPLVANFDVYSDFMNDYKKDSIYSHKYGYYDGGHSVKIIGWGVENGTDYWLVANSWNVEWGDDGFFKIKRGTNECNFENYVIGGIPEVQQFY